MGFFLHSNRLPLVIHFDLPCPSEFHKFVSLVGHIVDFLPQIVVFQLNSDI